MDKIDYTFKFSTELIVFVLSFFVVAINFAGASRLQFVNNNSLLTKLLAYHPRNEKLYSETTAVQSVTLRDNGFIPSASAQVILASDTGSGSGGNGSDSIITDNTIVNPNPDSVRTLITDQIKVYVTQPGDTLQSIAAKFNISTNTIIWANNLPNNTIKPGWDLVILPVNGVLHKVTNNDTLPDIAKRFNVDINNIISYNNLADENDINPGDLLIVPGGTVPAPKPTAKPKPAIANKVGNKIVYEPAPGDITEYGGGAHSFPWGQCTYYVARRRNIPWGGNARNWLTNASAYGAKIGKVPIVGAIVVTSESRYGHVALVEQISGDNFLVSEMNYKVVELSINAGLIWPHR